MVANAGIMQVGAVVDRRFISSFLAAKSIFIILSMLTVSVEDWNRVFAVNATGIMLCYKHAAIQMIKQGRGGRIIGVQKRGADH